MTGKPVIPRRLADEDIQGAIDHFAGEAGSVLALRFIDELEQTLERIGRHPAMGSPRYAHELGLPGLRFQLMRRFRYLVFYMEHDDHVDVWRVLHGSRDIPEWLQESG